MYVIRLNLADWLISILGSLQAAMSESHHTNPSTKGVQLAVRGSKRHAGLLCRVLHYSQIGLPKTFSEYHNVIL